MRVKLTRKPLHKQVLTQKQRDDIKRFAKPPRAAMPPKPDTHVEDKRFAESIQIDYEEIDESVLIERQA